MEQEYRDFRGGMDKDTSGINYQPGKYFDCLNMRIISDDTLTTSALQNIKGTTYFTSIPDIGGVVRITLDDYQDWNSVGPFDIQIGLQIINYTPPYAASLEEFYQDIADFINLNFTTSLPFAYVQDDGKALFIRASAASLSLIVVFPSDFTVDLSYIGPIIGATIIGWVALREDIYLITTEGVTVNPGGVDEDLTADPQTTGQIWRLQYDKITKVASTPVLLYHNYLNLTIEHPIANPGGIEARYENQDIQRIYWTDNFNVPRSFNVADPNGFALLPSSINITTPIIHSVPIIQEVLTGGGSLLAGVHQVAYRLKNTGGGSTTYSIPSNEIHITDRAEYLEYGQEVYTQESYQGANAGTITSKAIKFNIKDLDTRYERMEIVSIFKDAINSVPSISIILDVPVPSTGVYTFTYTGTEQAIPIELSTFNARNIYFRTVKTIAQKNNRLFPGNIKFNRFDIDFDARAYRFPLSDTQTNVTDAAANITTIDSTTWDASFAYLAEDADSIQDYSSQSPASYNNFLYKPNSTTVGGAGPNVSYVFISTDGLILDTKDIGTTGATKAPYRASNKFNTLLFLGINNQSYPIINGYRDHHNPSISGLLRGYTRDEMYRFGIVFYDKLGNPGFVKWIADIRMPHVWMPDTGSGTDTDRTMQYPISDFNTGICSGYPIGIEFTVDLSSLSRSDKEKISGFSIVRVKRTEDDKHIVGQGSIYPTILDGTDIFTTVDDTINAQYALDEYEDGVSMNSPEFLFNGPPAYAASDEFDVIGILEADQRTNIIDIDGNDRQDRMKVIKTYNFLTSLAPIQDIGNTLNPYAIVQTHEFPQWADFQNSFVDINGNHVWNRSSNNHRSGNGKTLYINSAEWQVNFDASGDRYAETDGWQGTFRLYLANYKKNPLLAYGGNSFAQRAANEYIPCGDFVPILDIDNNFYSPIIFGGDTFVTVFDNVKQFGNISADWQSEALYVGRFFPVETTINTELRQADLVSGESGEANSTHYRYVFNKQAIPTTQGDIGIGSREEFTYNSVYSAETDYIKYFPKPDPFIPNEEFDNRIYGSEVKINGELSDSWGIYKEANYLDVDGILGPINNLITLTNSLLYFQDRGVGKAAVEERALAPTSTGDITIGTTGVLSRFDYLTRETGSKHQFGFTKNDDTVWFFDCISRKIYELSGQGNMPISDIKGLHSYLNTNLVGDILITDNPYKRLGVAATFDYKNQEAIFTFLDTGTSFTVAYNIYTKAFMSFYSFVPSVYVNDKYHLFSSEVGSNLYIHDEGMYGDFYGTIYPSSLSLISNHLPTETKVLNNIEYLTEAFNSTGGDIVAETWDIARIRTFKQNTDFQFVSSIAKRKGERTWSIQVPRDRVLVNANADQDIFTDLSTSRVLFGKRIRDKYFTTDLIYNNADNLRLVMYYVKFMYLISSR